MPRPHLTRSALVIPRPRHDGQPISGVIDPMARTAATEWCHLRNRTSSMHPASMHPPGEQKFFSEQKLQEIDSGLPWNRLVKPAEIARSVVFLSDPAKRPRNREFGADHWKRRTTLQRDAPTAIAIPYRNQRWGDCANRRTCLASPTSNAFTSNRSA